MEIKKTKKKGKKAVAAVKKKVRPQVKQTISGTEKFVTSIIDKTSKITKIGNLKIKIFTTKGKIESLFKEIGRHVYDISDVQKASVPMNNKLKSFFKDVANKEKEIKNYENKIKKIKEDSEEKRK